MRHNVVLFDYDGVSFTGPSFSARMRERYGTPIETMLPFFKGPFHKCGFGRGDCKEAVAPFLAAWSFPETVDELMAFWFAIDDVDPEVRDVIAKLRADGVRVGLATDQEKYRTASLREKFGNGKIFDDVFTSAEIGCKKDDPRFFETVFATIGQYADNDKSKIVFLDDDKQNVLTARTFGFDAIHYKGPGDLAAIQ